MTEAGARQVSQVRSEHSARMALSCTVDSGDPAASELVDRLGAQAAWHQLCEGVLGAPLARRASQLNLDLVLRRAAAAKVRFVVPDDAEWPEGLADLRHCNPVQRRGGVPFGLWLRGPGSTGLLQRSVSIVGARAATSYGDGIAADLAAELAEHGVAVVSGGAYGIDAAAHRGALAAGGPTICVLANGVDLPYPAGNAALFGKLAAEQLLVSELPPGATPTRVRFLVRNRLIAALSLGTVVVEAALRSGARNTASWALECNRPLMAVPGPVHSSLSVGPHLLIRNGQATLVTSAVEVLEMISTAGDYALGSPHGPVRPHDTFEPSRLAVFEAVPVRRRAQAGEIALSAGVGLPVCLAELSALEEGGLVEGDESGWRVSRERGPG